MANFSMTCECGETMAVDAPSREAAITMLKGGMTQSALDEHFGAHHAGQEKPTLEQAHQMVEALVK
jgi:hypothetical protein